MIIHLGCQKEPLGIDLTLPVYRPTRIVHKALDHDCEALLGHGFSMPIPQ